MVRTAVNALAVANPAWVLLAMGCALASIVAMSEVTFLLMRAAGVSVRRRQALSLTFSANAWSTTLPGGPALSTLLQYRVQRSWGATPVAISWFVLLSGAISTMWLVLFGIGAIVFLGADLSVWSLFATGAVMAALAGAVHWASTHPQAVKRCLLAALPWFNRVLRRPAGTGRDAVAGHVRELSSVSLRPGRFALVAILSASNRLLDLATLWCAAAAVSEQPLELAGAALAYCSAKIVGATGVTPGGIGPVEAALTATLVGVGMPGGPALAAALVYRLISFIFITAVGWVVYAVNPKEKN